MAVAGAGSAFGQAFAFSDNDLLLGFNKAGAAATVLFDLGNVTTFVDTTGTQTITLASGTELLTDFSSNLGNLQFGAFAAYANSAPAGLAVSDLFVSRARSTAANATTFANAQATAATAYANQAADAQAPTATKINTIGNSAVNYTTVSGNTGANPGSHVAYVPATTGSGGSNPEAWTTIEASQFGSTFQTGNILTKTPSSFGASPAQHARVDLYLLSAGNAGSATDLGYFDLGFTGGSTATLTYTALAPIPEPRAYAAVAGLALVGFAMWRRRVS
jgi:hypothetical protein